jgi:hypothetical protein
MNSRLYPIREAELHEVFSLREEVSTVVEIKALGFKMLQFRHPGELFR